MQFMFNSNPTPQNQKTPKCAAHLSLIAEPVLGGHLVGGRIAARYVHGKLVLVDGRAAWPTRHRRRLRPKLHVHQSIIQVGRTLAAERAAARAIRMTVAAGPVRGRGGRRLRPSGRVTGGRSGKGK